MIECFTCDPSHGAGHRFSSFLSPTLPCPSFSLQDTKRENFPYERRPKSKAYIPADEGDYYYTAAVWGGYLEEMYKLVK